MAEPVTRWMYVEEAANWLGLKVAATYKVAQRRKWRKTRTASGRVLYATDDVLDTPKRTKGA